MVDLPASFTRTAVAVVLASIAYAPACSSHAATPTDVIDACNLFYTHLDGSGACQSCANNAPSMCNRAGIDAACSAMKGCADGNCVGAQCRCAGLAQCMADASDTCAKALKDYYACSNAGCASSCGSASAGCGDGTCAPGETCSSCPSDCGKCTGGKGCAACYPYETCVTKNGLPYCEHGIPCQGIGSNMPGCAGGCCWSFRAVDGNPDILQLECAPQSACGITPPPTRCINANGLAAQMPCSVDAQCCSNNCHIGYCDYLRKVGDPCQPGVDLCQGYCSTAGVCSCDATGTSCSTPGADTRCCAGVCSANNQCE